MYLASSRVFIFHYDHSNNVFLSCFCLERRFLLLAGNRQVVKLIFSTLLLPCVMTVSRGSFVLYGLRRTALASSLAFLLAPHLGGFCIKWHRILRDN